MEDFDEDPLDLLDDDGDGVIEMCLLFDDDKKTGSKPPSNSGCSIVLFLMGASFFLMVRWGVTKFIT